MNFILYAIIFVFGSLVGSFLNCVIYRLKEDKKYSGEHSLGVSFMRGRSFCPKCRHVLRWYDLVPILSFILLKRKCRYCQKKISFCYPLVEFFTAILFVLIFRNLTFGFDLSFGIWTLDFFYLVVISCLLIITFVYDLKHYIIPDKIIYPAIGLVFVYRLFELLNVGFSSDFGFRISDFQSFIYALFSAFSAAAFFFFIWLISKGKWMGFGDVKLGFFIGLFLGFPNVLVALFSTFLIGGIIGIVLVLFGKKKLRSEIPFGPFLVGGAFIALFWGEKIINWYLGFYGA